MRLPTRIVSTLLLAVSVVTCTDGPTGPRNSAGRASLALVPRFSDAAAASYNAVEDAGLVVDRARVILLRAANDTLKDTTAMFAAGDTAIALGITVPVAPGTRVLARLELRSGNILVYGGQDTVTTQIPNGPVNAPRTISLGYEGPDATATHISFTPHGGTFRSTAPLSLSAQVFDSSNAVLSGAFVSWTSSDLTVATVSRAGVLTFTGKSGSSDVAATSPGTGVSDHAVFTFAPAVASASRLRFDVQPPASTPALEPLTPAIVVSLVDSAGNIVTTATNSVTLTLGGGTAGATLAGTRTVAATNGRATFSGLSVDRAGVGYQLTANVTGIPLSLSSAFTITQPVPASVSISPAGGTLTALGDLLALSATVRDRNGNVLATVVPTWTSRAPAIAPVDSTGSVRAVANGSAYMVAQAGVASDSVLVTVRQQADTIFMSRDTLKLAFNDTATIVATALDRNRNIIADVPPTFTSADPTIATVTTSGRVQLVKSGTTTITATSGSRSARTVVTQGTAGTGITAAFAYLRITPGGGSVRLGSTTTLVAEYVNASSSATVVTPQWASSQPGRAPVSASGVMTTNDTGTVEITATRNGVTGHASFTILPAPMLTSFSFSPGTVSGVSTNTVKLGVTFGAFDQGNGIASVSATFTGPNGATASCSAATVTSGSPARGFWDCTLALPAGSPAGTWRATSVVLAGSITRSYDTTQLASFGSTTLTVNP